MDGANNAGSSAKKSGGPTQSTLHAFTKAKKLPKSVIEEMRAHNINVVAQRHTSLNFFFKR